MHEKQTAVPISPAPLPPGEDPIPGLVQRFLEIALPYWQGSDKRAAWAFLVALIGLMCAETQFAVMLNEQSGTLMSALAAHDAERFWHAVKITLMVMAAAVPVFALYYYARDAFSNRPLKYHQ